jgi:hypothetical protein
MARHRWPYEIALEFVQRRRRVACPNDGFRKALSTFATTLDLKPDAKARKGAMIGDALPSLNPSWPGSDTKPTDPVNANANILSNPKQAAMLQLAGAAVVNLQVPAHHSGRRPRASGVCGGSGRCCRSMVPGFPICMF